jgi:hypothetical protein
MNRIDQSVANLLEIIREQDKQIKDYRQLLIGLLGGIAMDDNYTRTILRQSGNQALLKIEGSFHMEDVQYKTLRYEWWHDLEMMEKNIPGDGQHIYCQGFAGANESELIAMFDRKTQMIGV